MEKPHAVIPLTDYDKLKETSDNFEVQKEMLKNIQIQLENAKCAISALARAYSNPQMSSSLISSVLEKCFVTLRHSTSSYPNPEEVEIEIRKI